MTHRIHNIQKDRLTPQQQEVFEHLRDYLAVNGYPPTWIEIGEALNMKKSLVQYHIETLESKGWIRRTAHKQRGIALIHKKNN